MPNLTPRGQQIVGEIASRYQLSFDAVACMLDSVMRGGGTMAQFNIGELGGSGQWMQGGMTMVGDMFNYGLQGRVASLCSELAPLVNDSSLFVKPKPFSRGTSNWWPEEFGSPNSSGGQNNCRYAYFANSRRLIVDLAGDVWIYDTLDHNINGVSQQQGSGSSWIFTSQYGTVNLSTLPVVARHVQNQPSSQFASMLNGGQSQQTASLSFQNNPPPNVHSSQTQSNSSNYNGQSSPTPTGDVVELLRKLGELRDVGVLSDQEFQNKKNELMSRL